MTTAIIMTIIAIAGLAIFRAYTIGDAAARHIARVEHGLLREEDPRDPLALLSEEQFLDLYERLRFRRFWAYLGVFLAFTIVAITSLMVVMTLVLELFDPGLYVSGFLTFFAFIAVCVASLAWTLRLHTKNLRPAMRNALDRSLN